MSTPCKIQVNFKDGKADLINVYADTADELAHLLNVLSAAVPWIEGTTGALRGQPAQGVQALQQGGLSPTPTPPPAAPTSGGEWGQPPAAPQVQTPTAGGPACAHGTRTWKEGTNKAGKGYKGWFCPINADGCAPTWVR